MGKATCSQQLLRWMGQGTLERVGTQASVQLPFFTLDASVFSFELTLSKPPLLIQLHLVQNSQLPPAIVIIWVDTEIQIYLKISHRKDIRGCPPKAVYAVDLLLILNFLFISFSLKIP